MANKLLLDQARTIADWIVDLRRKIHSNPELSYEEEETASLVAATLHNLGLEVREGVGGFGVTGLLRGTRAGKTVALRADMDALPVHELNEIPYRSKHANRMHACGHDGHTAMLLGAARLLTENNDLPSGNVKFIFQPAEELPPEGGAKKMIEDHVLENPPVDAIFGLHIWPDLPSGTLGVKAGPIMAAPDRFHLTIQGKGGHGATPHRTADSIVTAAQVILGLQTLVSRRLDPLQPGVLSICRIQAGAAYNILPEEVQLEGTTRYFNADLGALMIEQIEQIVSGICAASSCAYLLDYQYGFPPTINDPDMAELIADVGSEILGKKKVLESIDPSMTGEDFSYFLQHIPGCYFWLGTKNLEKGIHSPLHSAHFQVDEEIFPIGSAIMARAALQYLSQ